MGKGPPAVSLHAATASCVQFLLCQAVLAALPRKKLTPTIVFCEKSFSASGKVYPPLQKCLSFRSRNVLLFVMKSDSFLFFSFLIAGSILCSSTYVRLCLLHYFFLYDMDILCPKTT